MASISQAKLKAKEKKKRLKKLTERGPCRWCRNDKKQEKDPNAPPSYPPVDYKNIDLLQRFVTPQGKIFSRKRSGNCGSHQRALKFAIKYARFLALMPYVG